jgi:hypothetical protein
MLHEHPKHESEATVIENVCRPTTAGRSVRMMLFALLVGGTIMLMLSYDPAEAATTFTVTENGDDADINLSNSRCDSSTDTGDQCTLRAAIEEANDTPGADTIVFDIVSTASVKTISPLSPLPTISDTVTIDGYTQPGASPNTLDEGNDAVFKVQLDGPGPGSAFNGLEIEADNCTVKGLVIRDFDDAGVLIAGSGATDNHIEGNFVGTNREGTIARGNPIGLYVASESNTIGGTEAEERNVISGNTFEGVLISGPDATENSVKGNYIGTTADGTAALGNGGIGGVVIQGPENIVGGRASGAGNVISGNDRYGVFVSGFSDGDENRIEGNFIGTTASGTGDLGNTEAGVSVENGAELTAVGGTRSGAPNRIAHNGGDGVSVRVDSTVGTNILSNRIFDNGDLGIDLDADGVTANDSGDLDTGPNNLQNFPVITSARKGLPTPRKTTISGRLNSDPSQIYFVECFLTDGAPASAHGEGSRLLGSAAVFFDSAGVGRFSCVSTSPLLGQVPGQTVSATATNVLTGDTSEFSRNRAVVTVP